MWLTCIELSCQTMLLWMESQTVIGLRVRKIAEGGPAAFIEMNQMVSEKVGAVAEAAETLLVSGSIKTVIRGFRTHVNANEARLLAR